VDKGLELSHRRIFKSEWHVLKIECARNNYSKSSIGKFKNQSCMG